MDFPQPGDLQKSGDLGLRSRRLPQAEVEYLRAVVTGGSAGDQEELKRRVAQLQKAIDPTLSRFVLRHTLFQELA